MKVLHSSNSEEFKRQALANLGQQVFTTFCVKLIPAKSEYALRLGSRLEPALFCFDQHLERLARDAKRLEIKISSSDLFERLKLEIFSKLKALYSQEKIFNQQTKIILVKIVLSQDLIQILTTDYSPAWSTGQTIKLFSVQDQRYLPEHKTTNSLVSVLARRQANINNAQEALLVDHAGMVREGAWSNIFWFDQAGKLYSTANKILPGITRQAICENFEVALLDLRLEELLKEAKEVFITQSTSAISSVSQINQTVLVGAPGPATCALQKSFTELVNKISTPIFK